MFSRVIRRVHMYLGLFLTPWMLMYALSTAAMNHRPFFRQWYGGEVVAWEKEQESLYPGTFAQSASPRQVAEQILGDLRLTGSYGVNGDLDKGKVTIQRHDPISPRRITYNPADGTLLLEKQSFRTAMFLERLHRRRGYQQDYLLEDVWAGSVDLVIVAMVFWVLSGLWMWWELRSTRFWGAVCLAIGPGLFVVFLLTI